MVKPHKEIAILTITIAVFITFFVFPVGQIADTHSMEPTLVAGQAVMLSRFIPDNLTGQIVCINSVDAPGMQVAHRCIVDMGSMILTKGDNNQTNPVPDSWIHRSNVIGVEIFVFPSFTIFMMVLTANGICLIAAFISLNRKVDFSYKNFVSYLNYGRRHKNKAEGNQ